MPEDKEITVYLLVLIQEKESHKYALNAVLKQEMLYSKLTFMNENKNIRIGTYTFNRETEMKGIKDKDRIMVTHTRGNIPSERLQSTIGDLLLQYEQAGWI